jgi:hypothetical protein
MNSKFAATNAEAEPRVIELRRQDAGASAAPSNACATQRGKNSLTVSRSDIEFFNIARHLVAIQVKVTNDSDAFSAPDTLQLLAAPFGAFVPWQPLAAIALPTLAPGSTRYVRWRADVAQGEPLGSPDGIGPRDLLTAFGLADEPPDRSVPKGQEEMRLRAAAASRVQAPARLPPDLMELLVHGAPHWAGNINVLVGRTDVERHLARALRVYPGRVNMACFIVGHGGHDAYAFRIRGLRSDWDARLFDMTSRESLVINSDDSSSIATGEWIESQGSRAMLLALRIPSNCEAAAVEVHVAQKSTGREAVVEFSLDPRAAGRGCYTV